MITAALQRLHLDPETKIAVRHQIQAQAVERRMSAQGLATDQGLTFGELATDRHQHQPETPPLGAEMRALYRKARLDPSRAYSQAEVDQALADSGLDVTSRIALKTELAMRQQVRASGVRQVQAGRDLRAAAERPRPTGQVLRDPDGRPRVLRSHPW